MATPDTFELNKFLVCNICMEMYKDPKSLDCRHVFCGPCLVSLYKANRRLICPLCRKLTSLPDNRDSVENRIRRLPSDFNMLSLTELSVKSKKQAVTENRLQCEEHGEILSMYCKDHDKAICLVCAYSAKLHRACVEVVTVNDEAKARRDLLRALKDKVSETDGLRSVLERNKRRRHRIAENKKKVSSNIKSYYEKLHNELHVMETHMLEYTEKRIDKELSTVDGWIEAQEKVVSMNEGSRNLVPHLLEDASDLEVCMSDRFLKGKFQRYTEDIPKDNAFTRQVPILKHKINFNVDIETVRRLKPCPVRFAHNWLSPFVDNVYQLQTRFDDDKMDPQIRGMTILGDNNDLLLMSDVANKKMKLIPGFKESAFHRRQLCVTYTPLSIISLSQFQAVGVHPEHKKLLYIEIIDDEIRQRKKVSTKKLYKCLTKLDDKLIAVASMPPSFDILCHDGKLLTEVHLDLTHPILPVSVSVTSSGHFAVSDQGSRSVIVLDTSGNLVGWTHSPNKQSLWSVCGVCCDEYGNIFVVDSENRDVIVIEEAKESHAAFSLSEDTEISHSAFTIVMDSNCNSFLADGSVINVFKLTYA